MQIEMMIVMIDVDNDNDGNHVDYCDAYNDILHIMMPSLISSSC